MQGAGDAREEFLIVARVRRPHGIAGEVLVAIDTDRPEKVFRPGRTLLLGNAAGERTGRELKLIRMRPGAGGAILKLEGITRREDSDPLRGHTLVIPATEAEPAAHDEVHYRDLIGLRARTDERDLGKVEELLEMPGGVTLVIRDDGGREVLVPFVSAFVVEVRIASGELILKLPDGMIDI